MQSSIGLYAACVMELLFEVKELHSDDTGAILVPSMQIVCLLKLCPWTHTALAWPPAALSHVTYHDISCNHCLVQVTNSSVATCCLRYCSHLQCHQYVQLCLVSHQLTDLYCMKMCIVKVVMHGEHNPVKQVSLPHQHIQPGHKYFQCASEKVASASVLTLLLLTHAALAHAVMLNRVNMMLLHMAIHQAHRCTRVGRQHMSSEPAVPAEAGLTLTLAQLVQTPCAAYQPWCAMPKQATASALPWPTVWL